MPGGFSKLHFAQRFSKSDPPQLPQNFVPGEFSN
jgi:hypothetical protein